MKRNRKAVSILLTLSLLVVLLVSMVGPASAASTYSMNYVQKISAGFEGDIGTLVITMDPASASTSVNKYVYLSLPSSPSGYKLDVGGSGISGTNYFNTSVAQIIYSKTKGNELCIQVSAINTTNPDPNADSRIYVPLNIKVPSGVSGDVTLTADAPSTSTFSSGSIVVARVGVSKVKLAVENVPTITSSGGKIGVIQIKEDTAGSLVDSGGTAALKLRLPPGFKWREPVAGSINVVWGNLKLGVGNFSRDNDNRDLLISVSDAQKSTSGTNVKLELAVDVDESVAKAGDVKVTVSGATTAEPSELVVATYGEYGLTAKAFNETPEIISGKVAQDIGKLEIVESSPGSILDGRTLTLTLPETVRWSQAPNIDTEYSSNYGNIQINSSLVGSDGRMLKVTFSGNTQGQTEPAKIVLKNMQVTPAADFSGDLKVELGGSQGISGTVVLAKVTAPVTASASSKPDVIIGKAGQLVGDITITEQIIDGIRGTVKGYQINNDYVNSTTPGGQAKLIIEAPAGVTFTSTPSVEVVSGDLVIDASAVSTDKTSALEGQILIPIKSSSTTPATIKISNIKVTVDRTVPEGDLAFKVKGTAVNETITGGTLFEGHNTVAKVVAANCTTPAPAEKKSEAVFRIGDAKFTVNGVEKTMDVAPYIKNGRTFLPVRYVAQALGVSEGNIMWNGDDQTVVLIKGDRVVKLQIGSNTMYINGVSFTMDVAPELVDPGRTMLPFRWVAQALGAEVTWDEATQTVTMKL